jgi:SAM-dependent methyltransferase
MTSHTPPPTAAHSCDFRQPLRAGALRLDCPLCPSLVRPQGSVLDLACGMGRHTRFFSALNHTLTSVDKAPERRGPWRISPRRYRRHRKQRLAADGPQL